MHRAASRLRPLAGALLARAGVPIDPGSAAAALLGPPRGLSRAAAADSGRIAQALDRISVTDVVRDVERRRGSLLPGAPVSYTAHGVITLDPQDTVGSALDILSTHNIISCPVFTTNPAGTMKGGGEYDARVEALGEGVMIQNTFPQCLGFIDATDLMRVMVSMARQEAKQQWADTGEEVTLSEAVLATSRSFLAVKLEDLQPSTDGELLPYRAGSTISLRELVQKHFLHTREAQEGFWSRPSHRVALFDANDHFRLSGIVSQLDIISFIHEQLRPRAEGADAAPLSGAIEDLRAAAAPLMSATVKELGLAPSQTPVLCVPASEPAIYAFARMYDGERSAVGVVSHGGDELLGTSGPIIATLCAFDLRGLTAETIGDLALPTWQFLYNKAIRRSCVQPPGGAPGPDGQPEPTYRHSNGASVRPAKSLYDIVSRRHAPPGERGVAGSAGGAGAGAAGSREMDTDVLRRIHHDPATSLLVCYLDTPLHTVVRLLVERRRHSIFVLSDEAVEHPVGVITLTDVLRLLFK